MTSWSAAMKNGLVKNFLCLSTVYRDNEKLARKLLIFNEDRQTATEEA